VEHILKVAVTAMLSGFLGIGLGALLGIAFKNISNRSFAFVLEISAGLMLSLVCFSLIPDALNFSNIYIVFAGLFLGIAFVAFLQEKVYIDLIKRKNTGYFTTGILTFVTLSVYNFSEGFAIGTGLDISRSFAISLLLIILTHDIPEGVAISLPLRKSGVKTLIIGIITIVTGVFVGLGAFIGAYLGYISNDFMALFLSVVGGMMLYISLGDIIPQSKKIHKGRFATFGNCLGFLTGIVVSLVL